MTIKLLPCQACEDAAKVCESRADELGRRAGLFAESQAEATRLALRIRASCRHAQPAAPGEGMPEEPEAIIRTRKLLAENCPLTWERQFITYLDKLSANHKRLQAENALLKAALRDFSEFTISDARGSYCERKSKELGKLRDWHAAAIAIAGKP